MSCSEPHGASKCRVAFEDEPYEVQDRAGGASREGVGADAGKPRARLLLATVTDVAACLAAGADVNARDRFDDAPLRAAVNASGEPAVIEVLLAAGADPNARYSGAWTPLHTAAYRAEDAVVITMLIEAGADLEARDRDEIHTVGGRTPLHIAVLSGADLAAIEALLAAGADINARNTDGGTPLHMAKMHPAQAEVAAILLAAGADLNARAVDSLTPLHTASTPALFPSLPWGGEVVSTLSDPALIKVLLEGGAEVNARQEHRQRTPLHLVAMNGADPAAIEALLAAGAEVDARDNDGATPLHSAAAYRRGEVVEALLAAGADPNAPDADGNTPLHHAGSARDCSMPRPSLRPMSWSRTHARARWFACAPSAFRVKWPASFSSTPLTPISIPAIRPRCSKRLQGSISRSRLDA